VGAGFYIGVLAIGDDISYFLVGAIVMIVELVRVIPLMVQGIGVRETAFWTCLGSWDRSDDRLRHQCC